MFAQTDDRETDTVCGGARKGGETNFDSLTGRRSTWRANPRQQQSAGAVARRGAEERGVEERGKLSSLLTVKTLTGMTTDVYPRENCIAPAIVLIVWTTNTKK